MTAAQRALCFFEFGQLRDVLRARGLKGKAIDEFRDVITIRACGRLKSWNDCNDKDVDEIIAKIKAERAPADFNAQMRLQDMPEKRHALVVARIDYLSRHVGLNAGGESAYVATIARNMHGSDDLGALTVQQLGKIEGALRRRLKQQKLTLEAIHETERQASEHAAAQVATTQPTFAAESLVSGEDY